MGWKGEAEHVSYGIRHKAICPLLKQWRQVAKGKATVDEKRRGPLHTAFSSMTQG